MTLIFAYSKFLLYICSRKMNTSTITQHIAAFQREEVYYIVDEALGLNLQPQLAIHAGEETKTLETVARIWDWLLAQHATRRALVVCIGGGVVTDLGGFAASAYRRGVDYVNIPTTLLSMVDAATGGKTGINYGGLKNAIGVIRQPLDTIILPQWLETLPQQQLLSGYGEVVKTALLDQHVWQMGILPENVADYIDDILAVKQRIVAADPTEQGLRKALNLGHTIGHAIEELTIHRFPDSPIHQLPHGYAVLYGLVAELYLSVIKLGLDRQVLQQVAHLMVEYFGRPQCACSDYNQLIGLMRDDKKNEQVGQINFTLLKAIGEPIVNCTATEQEIKEALDYLFTI